MITLLIIAHLYTIICWAYLSNKDKDVFELPIFLGVGLVLSIQGLCLFYLSLIVCFLP